MAFPVCVMMMFYQFYLYNSISIIDFCFDVIIYHDFFIDSLYNFMPLMNDEIPVLKITSIDSERDA